MPDEKPGIVQVAPSGGGANIDNSELTRADGTIVERQRVAVSDPRDPDAPGLAIGGEPGKGMTAGERAIIALLQSIDRQLTELLFLVKLRGG